MDPLILLADRTSKELCFVASALLRIGAPYALIGATALLLHGISSFEQTSHTESRVASEHSNA